jgi:hypothetical protein
MASINATTSSGIVATADNTGQLQLQSAGTTSATFNTFGIGLGTATPSSGIGITFPATQSASSDANTLDDYEEGTWTPTDTSGANLSFTTDYATYTKIGRTVTVQAGITYPSTANGSSAKIGGLPFTAANAITVSVIYSTATVANFTYLSGNTTDLFALTPGLNVTNATLSTKLIQLAGTYQV